MDDPNQSVGLAYAPPFDHTTETPYGHYLYFYDAADSEDSATVLSELVSIAKDSCFSFWVHMFGDEVSYIV